MNVILETLSNGLFRCTVRHHGATMSFVDHSNPKQAVLEAMRQGAASHMFHDGSFDMTHLQLNDAAKQALAPAPDWAVLGPKLAEAVQKFWKLREQQLLALGYSCVAEYEALCVEGDEHLALRDALALVPAA